MPEVGQPTLPAMGWHKVRLCPSSTEGEPPSHYRKSLCRGPFRNIEEEILLLLKVDGFVKSLNNVSFRAKREILPMQHAENTRFLLAVEMTDSSDTTFYKGIKIYATAG